MVESAQLKGHWYPIHFFDRCIFLILYVGMDDLIRVVLFELPVSLFETLEIVEECEQRREALVILNFFGGDFFDFALFKLLLWLHLINFCLGT